MRERVDPVYVLLCWWPLLWHATGAVLAWWLPAPWGWVSLPFWVLVLPALLCRACDRLWPVRGTVPVASAAGRRWWWMQQLQMPFARLPFIEECLRLLPGIYPLWLRVWGGRVSLTCVFAPQAVVTDRQLLVVERGVVLGTDCILAGHLVGEGPERHITVAPVTIRSGALIGARALVGPGVEVAAGETVPATQPLPPYSIWRDGRRQKGASA